MSENTAEVASKRIKVAILGGVTRTLQVDLGFTLGGLAAMLRDDEEVRANLGNPDMSRFKISLNTTPINTGDRELAARVLDDGDVVMLSPRVSGAGARSV